MLSWVLGGKRSPGKRTAPDYEKAKRTAESGSVRERAKLASYNDLDPEFLYFFASDKSVEVRRAVAKNDGTPLQADVILAEDADIQVRMELAHKIGGIIPTLTEEENERLTEMAMQVLEILARDNEAAIRAAIAEEIKMLTNVPNHLVRQLARDAEDIVAIPILKYSPLLTQQELAQIIASGVTGGALAAVACREAITGEVAEAIVATADKEAIKALLENATATISKKAYDIIGAKAPDAPEWHRPLVDRSNLSPQTIRRIATFVSAALFERLIDKHGLDEDTEAELRLGVRQRIEDGDLPDPDNPREPADERAKKLHETGSLTEDAVQAAIEDGDIALVPHALVLLSGIPLAKVKAILASDNGKAVTALVWKAGLGMHSSVMIQRRVARVLPKNMVHDSKKGAFPIAEDELKWFLDYFV